MASDMVMSTKLVVPLVLALVWRAQRKFILNLYSTKYEPKDRHRVVVVPFLVTFAIGLVYWPERAVLCGVTVRAFSAN